MNRQFLLVSFALLLAGACAHTVPSATAPAEQFTYQRVYREGRINSYRLTTRYTENGKLKKTLTATAQLTENMGEAPHEVVRWKGLIRDLPDGARENLDDRAGAVEPYSLSLLPGGNLDLPQLKVEEMVSAVTDLHTFFVALGPAIGIANLHVPGDEHHLAEPAVGKWTNGKKFILGEDCINISIKLVELGVKEARFVATFAPPDGSCLTHPADWMGAAVVEGKPNNIQQVLNSGNGKVMVMYGLEQFQVGVRVDRLTGRLHSGSMKNSLQVKMRINCSADTLDQCVMETPVMLIERELALELL